MTSIRRLAWLGVLAVAWGATAPAHAQQEPDAAVMALMQSLGDYHPEAVWDALPPSYQQDVKDVIADFANRMDAEIWDKSFVVLKKLVVVLQTKKDFILAQPMLMQMPPDKKASLQQHWDGVVGVMSTLVNSQISTLQGVKTLDPRAFLATTGASVMRQGVAIAQLADPAKNPAAKVAALKRAKVTIVRRDGPDAVVLRLEVPGEKAEEKPFSRVEGKWIPADMAQTWKPGVAQAKQKLAQMNAQKMAQQKPQIMNMLMMVENSLDQLAAAQTQDQFNAISMGLGGMLMGMMAQMQQHGRTNARPGGGMGPAGGGMMPPPGDPGRRRQR